MTRSKSFLRSFDASVDVCVVACLVILVSFPRTALCAAEPLRVVATLPDLGNLAQEVGGDLVDVTVVVKGPEDPHFAEPKPSFIKALNEADVFLLAGLDLEIGYAPLLLQNARNANVLPAGRGYIDASTAVTPTGLPSVQMDRSMGDVHPLGNPHYLLDPLNGLAVAALIRDRFTRLRPDDAAIFASRYEDLRNRIGVAFVGQALAQKYDAGKLALLFEHGKLTAFLESQADAAALEGWLGMLASCRGTKVVDDHRIWPYFARRFGIEVFGELEPLPGVPPTTRHLTELIERMRAANVRIILTLPYYDPRHARFVAEATDATVVPLAHQVGALPEATDYVAMIDYDVRQLAQACRRTQAAGR